MENNLKRSILTKLNSVAEALKRNHMDACVVETKEELCKKIAELIGKDETVFSGGSITLKEAGVIDMLNENGYDYYFRGRLDENGNEIDVMRKAFSGDWFLTSSNAITLDGKLYNVDGNGNRVAALTFGPKNVIVVAGYNKIVNNIDEAIERVRSIAAPANCVRLNLNTGCRAKGYCANCHSDDRVCCAHTVHSFQRINGRIRVFLLPEELGY